MSSVSVQWMNKLRNILTFSHQYELANLLAANCGYKLVAEDNEDTTMQLNYIGDANINGVPTTVYRNEAGKFYIKLNGLMDQKELHTADAVRFLLSLINGDKDVG